MGPGTTRIEKRALGVGGTLFRSPKVSLSDSLLSLVLTEFLPDGVLDPVDGDRGEDLEHELLDHRIQVLRLDAAMDTVVSCVT